MKDLCRIQNGYKLILVNLSTIVQSLNGGSSHD
jgi:hypothetical protein